jgi:hypothetical protein
MLWITAGFRYCSADDINKGSVQRDKVSNYLPDVSGLINRNPKRNGLLIESFNGKPQALPLDFAYACGSPLHENDQ